MNNQLLMAIKKIVFSAIMLLLVIGCVTISKKPSIIETLLPHDVDAIASSRCTQLTLLPGRMLSFPTNCLGMLVEAYNTDGIKEEYRLTRSGLLKERTDETLVILGARVVIIDRSKCPEIKEIYTGNKTELRFPSRCLGMAVKVISDKDEYRLKLERGRIGIEEIKPLTQEPHRPPRQPPKVKSKNKTKTNAGKWEYEKTARAKATHQEASAVCRKLKPKMQLPLHDAFSRVIGLRGLQLSPSGEWANSVNAQEAIMVDATSQDGRYNYKVIYKNHLLPYRCARKIK